METRNRIVTFVAAAALGVGAFGIAGCKDETGKTPGQKVGEAVDKTTQKASEAGQSIVGAVSPKGQDKLENTRGTLEGVVQNAVKRNEWDDMADNFTGADKTRVMTGKPDTKDLDDLADKFTTLWNDKYKDKFTVMSANDVFSTGFVTNLKEESTANSKTATGTIAAANDMPALDLKFVGENGNWRLDIPDSVDAAKLHANLKKALGDLQDSSGWPADKMQAARIVSHKILAAVMDKM